jgi:hypothetical protein
LTEHNHHIAQIERDMALINEHCYSTDNEFRKAVQRYREDYCRAAEQVMELAITQASQGGAAAKGLTDQLPVTR